MQTNLIVCFVELRNQNRKEMNEWSETTRKHQRQIQKHLMYAAACRHHCRKLMDWLLVAANAAKLHFAALNCGTAKSNQLLAMKRLN